ncbi:tyrosine-type recombinase/integrase [Bacillaceae bacterium S4-13-58]
MWRCPTPIKTKEANLHDLFNVFMKAKQLEGLSERTLKDHQSPFKYFDSYREENFPSLILGKDISKEVIRDYIFYMSITKGLSPVTVNIRLRSLKCFFKFLYDENHIPINPTERIKLMKTPEDTIPAFSKEQITQILLQPDQQSYAGFRDYVLMMTFLDTGIRCKEVLGLETMHFNEMNKTITIPAYLAKNRKERTLPLSSKTTKLFKTLTQETRALEEREDFIFLSNYGSQLDGSGIRERIRIYGKKAGITNVRVSPHTFRHTFTKFYILNGGDPFTLQRILGHSTMNMVRKYVQMNGEDIQFQHTQFSPIHHLLKDIE